ncbi:MAG: prepilin-type N-terminal cleavage/methylation domain-containing protein [Parcubacteria group bacterium]
MKRNQMRLEIKSKRQNGKGFTLIELLIIIAIIGILLTAILVNIYFAKTKAGDNSAFTSFKSAATAAYMCLLTGTPGIRLSTPTDATLPSLCMSGATPVVGFSAWPIVAKDGWVYGNGSFLGDGFFWCNLSNNPSPVSCGNLVDGVCGQSSGSGSFCYGLKNGSKSIWCSQDGCHKVGF